MNLVASGSTEVFANPLFEQEIPVFTERPKLKHTKTAELKKSSLGLFSNSDFGDAALWRKSKYREPKKSKDNDLSLAETLERKAAFASRRSASNFADLKPTLKSGGRPLVHSESERFKPRMSVDFSELSNPKRAASSHEFFMSPKEDKKAKTKNKNVLKQAQKKFIRRNTNGGTSSCLTQSGLFENLAEPFSFLELQDKEEIVKMGSLNFIRKSKKNTKNKKIKSKKFGFVLTKTNLYKQNSENGIIDAGLALFLASVKPCDIVNETNEVFPGFVVITTTTDLSFLVESISIRDDWVESIQKVCTMLTLQELNSTESGGQGQNQETISTVTTASGKNLAEILQNAGNNSCAECEAPNCSEWVSINLGIFICIECSGVHRSLGSHISKVRSCVLDTNFITPEMLEFLDENGNKKSNDIWEYDVTEPFTKLHSGSSKNEREKFIKAKYVDKLFRMDALIKKDELKRLLINLLKHDQELRSQIKNVITEIETK